MVTRRVYLVRLDSAVYSLNIFSGKYREIQG